MIEWLNSSYQDANDRETIPEEKNHGDFDLDRVQDICEPSRTEIPSVCADAGTGHEERDLN